MNTIFKIFLIVFLFSCTHEDSIETLYYAEFNGKRIDLTGDMQMQQYSDFKHGNLKRKVYHFFNVGDDQLFISVLDSLDNKYIFSKNEVYATFNDSFYASTGKSYYESINGIVDFIQNEKGNIKLEFEFILVNKSDNLDTLKIYNGYLETKIPEYNYFIRNF